MQRTCALIQTTSEVEREVVRPMCGSTGLQWHSSVDAVPANSCVECHRDLVPVSELRGRCMPVDTQPLEGRQTRDCET